MMAYQGILREIKPKQRKEDIIWEQGTFLPNHNLWVVSHLFQNQPSNDEVSSSSEEDNYEP
jgi:hypothetical protein